MKTIRFDGDKHGTTYLGRNRHGACHGVQAIVFRLNPHFPKAGTIELAPINRTGTPTQACFIQIPKEDLPALIEMLQSFLPPEGP